MTPIFTLRDSFLMSFDSEALEDVREHAETFLRVASLSESMLSEQQKDFARESLNPPHYAFIISRALTLAESLSFR
jgi:hypothetical protein